MAGALKGYQPGTIAGHEPCAQIIETGPGCKEFKVGDRVILYHISGCGVCDDCKAGYMISCRNENRAAEAYRVANEGRSGKVTIVFA